MLPHEQFADNKPTVVEKGPSHEGAWMQACKGHGTTGSNFEYAAKLTETVLLSFIYLIANGALDWGPVKRLRPLPGTTTERTTDTTVRRIAQDTGQAA